MRTLIVVTCILPFILAGQAALSGHGPESAVRAAYVADQPAIQHGGDGVMADPALRARFFSRSLLRAIDFDAEQDALSPAPAIVNEPLSDLSPHFVDLAITPVSESGNAATIRADFARGDGAREKLTFAMVYERGEWRIDDITYALLDGKSHTLRGDLRTN